MKNTADKIIEMIDALRDNPYDDILFDEICDLIRTHIIIEEKQNEKDRV